MAEPETGGVSSTEEDPGWPIGFMILVGLAALYVGWRLVQLIGRLLGWLF